MKKSRFSDEQIAYALRQVGRGRWEDALSHYIASRAFFFIAVCIAYDRSYQDVRNGIIVAAAFVARILR